MPIGAYKDFPYSQETFQVESGDVLFVLSDGLPELFNKQKEMYNFHRVDEKLLEFGKLEPQEIINGFVKSIDEWLEDKLPDDDITLMVIKFR